MTTTPHPAAPTVPPQPELVERAIELAARWTAATEADATPAERRATERLAALVADPAGLELAVRFVDRVARPEDVRVAAQELVELGDRAADARGFLGTADRGLLALGSRMAPLLPQVVVPAARIRLRQLVGHLVADAGPGLTGHIARARRDGFRLNLNLLGEAVLGEDEAQRRLRRVQDLVVREDVDYVSVKVSAVASQLSTWDTAGSVHRVVERLRPLYRVAAAHGTFLNLDMEEYRDLEMTIRVFDELLSDPELRDYRAGIVLQAYLPDTSAALEELTEIARRRTADGGAPLKVRLVKGANLAMERVEAELHDWPQAPYTGKPAVDAHYLRLVHTALDPARIGALRVGIASHNLFHVAYAHLLAEQRGVTDGVDIEMLQGMAPAQSRAVQRDTGQVLLYTPVVAKDDFDVAISYLVRRLEENAAPENFLHALFAGEDATPAAPTGTGLDAQLAAFRAAVAEAATVSTEPRRIPRPPVDLTADPGPFHNASDTDPAVAASRDWAAALVARDVPAPDGAQELTSPEQVDRVIDRARAAAPAWSARTPAERAAVLRRAAAELEAVRGDLVATMVHEGGKTVAEADPEVSEAIDFARYYADRALDLADGAVPGARFRPEGVTLVTPPWNFPVAIPTGSVLAALAAGSPVVIKPAPQTPRCVRVAMAAVQRALDAHQVTEDAVQVVLTDEGETGRHLITHSGVDRLLLTGALETARLFTGWRPELEVMAETSGKNALVITPSADVDLAVADLVRSAFGHAGQKCSAASLAILVGSAGRSDRLRRQLADAVTSLRVGPADDLGTTMGPLIEPAQGKLLRALTTLDEGESWLVRPRQLDQAGRSWTPGVKLTHPGSWFHQTECFGPVLGIIRVDTLDEALAVQNDVALGLTGGLHSLDPAEIDYWLDRVQVGNAYLNRHITGAVVQRQPFGGWKASVVGPGAKAGGPHYVAQLGRWQDDPEVAGLDDDAWLAWAVRDDARVWAEQYGIDQDPTGLAAEENTLRHRPVPQLTVRVGADARERDLRRVLAAARTAGVPVIVSRVDQDGDFDRRVAEGAVSGRIRVVGTAPGLRAAAAARAGEVTILDGPVLASGERELLTVLREQAVSRTRHRFGHIDPTR
ncbi:bifunctional proline dehydrogenase/L-glutamate gamma-semialdehyde dehydrogenase [Cellulomonas denverensis]|uniref:L-glutamate gamma-semialdehyde dehydrogenase n=1 Tax=Cellulomonas denverensis TaxID=264297 RepID=A0A7X6KUD4_9CELL|nr:bifunctional proline dehydrogenase/L-glutamate gamma-semialdehyde dehydrogenase [Cellulomonas denverensis]NKY22482.1 bifunctional proline dehydrogenase/L-glutamate gamma-semialdehyde dehydrogenase [Cellulomonas denverensis]GIG25955.1 1-pyrroline-5-carboxylate dehydrogenase [Cellulomonas denverensis]